MTREEVEAAQRAFAEARTTLRKACKAFAKDNTGWEVGNRLRDVHEGDIIEVHSFLGVHPQRWGCHPMVRCKVVKKNGETGLRDRYCVIDTIGHWRRKLEKIE